MYIYIYISIYISILYLCFFSVNKIYNFYIYSFFICPSRLTQKYDIFIFHQYTHVFSFLITPAEFLFFCKIYKNISLPLYEK